jgi:signal transduction histidine kinase
VAAHELRTPLTTLSLQIRSMAREIDRRALAGGLETTPKAALRGGRHLAALVENMVDIARVASGTTQIVLLSEPADLLELASEVAERFVHAASITVTGARGVVGSWDRLRLDEVVTNLLSSAAKFGGDRGVAVRVERDGELARLAVTDHGIGIAPEDQARVFEPFERAASSDRCGGLGLFIARRIVEAHGGSIRIESAPGAGATFLVEQPIAT